MDLSPDPELSLDPDLSPGFTLTVVNNAAILYIEDSVCAVCVYLYWATSKAQNNGRQTRQTVEGGGEGQLMGTGVTSNQLL